MKVLTLHWALLLALFVASARANTEKVIFVAPGHLPVPQEGPGLQHLHLDALSPTASTLRTLLPVSFPSDQGPRGTEHWFLLQSLTPHQRHELRVCWAAVQPTAFHLDVFTLTHVFETTALIQALATYADTKQISQPVVPYDPRLDLAGGILFLRVEAAADFFTSNKSLMLNPPPVLVDIVLDPYLGSIVPKSLLPTAAYIATLGSLAFYVSGALWNRIKPDRKQHTD